MADDKLVYSFASVVREMADELTETMERVKKAEEVVHVIGEVSGMLDVCDGEDAKKLYDLCHECRKRLQRAANDYWKTVEK